jgi:hypothetical protein
MESWDGFLFILNFGILATTPRKDKCDSARPWYSLLVNDDYLVYLMYMHNCHTRNNLHHATKNTKLNVFLRLLKF